MLLNNRIIFSDNGTLIDLSRELNTVTAGSRVFNYTTAQDYLYIGSDMPFNHRYFQLNTVAPGTANAVAAVASVEIWDGSAWNSAVDVLDDTQSTLGTSLSGNGIISWVVDRNKNWGLEDTTENIPALSTLKIYRMYWARLSWSATFTATTSLFYVGHKFSTDNDLRAWYPDLLSSDVLDAFQTGKTEWNAQTILAAEEIVRDLRKKGVIWSRNQILDWQQFTDASIQKTAQIIYNGFGTGQEVMRQNTKKLYEDAMNKMVFNVDKTGDGRLDRIEKVWCPVVVRR